MIISLIISVVFNVALGTVLFRFSRRLLQFDEIWQGILPVLFEYAEDLRKMLSADLLIDNPDVIRFHKRNQQALSELDSITESVKFRVREKKRLPRPDVE